MCSTEEAIVSSYAQTTVANIHINLTKAESATDLSQPFFFAFMLHFLPLTCDIYYYNSIILLKYYNTRYNTHLHFLLAEFNILGAKAFVRVSYK